MFTLDEVREAIKDKPEFTLRLKEGYWNVDYNVEFETTFQGRTERETEILLNCRGTCFDLDGNINRLCYKKFKNLGQGIGYQPEDFDFSKPHRIEEKVDGSMIAPVLISTDEWVLGTRAGETTVSTKADDYLEELYKSNPKKFNQIAKFISLCLELGFTPIFEYIGRDNRIVIDYPESKLILHGIRNMKTGEMVYDLESFVYPFTEIDLIKKVVDESSSITEVANHIYTWSGDNEGVVVKFDDGRMVKIKSQEYVKFHSAISSIAQEKHLLKLILENTLDDVIPLLQKDRQESVLKYSDSVNHFIALHDTRMKWEFEQANKIANGNRKQFAEIAKENPMYSMGMFKLLDGKNFSLREFAVKKCGSSTDVESVRWLIGPSIDLFQEPSIEN